MSVIDERLRLCQSSELLIHPQLIITLNRMTSQNIKINKTSNRLSFPIIVVDFGFIGVVCVKFAMVIVNNCRLILVTRMQKWMPLFCLWSRKFVVYFEQWYSTPFHVLMLSWSSSIKWQLYHMWFFPLFFVLLLLPSIVCYWAFVSVAVVAKSIRSKESSSNNQPLKRFCGFFYARH